MKIVELENQIRNSPKTLTFTLQHDQPPKRFYTLTYKLDEANVQEQGVVFYVTNRGQPEETAYIMGGNPVKEQVAGSTFLSDVNNALTEYVKSNSINVGFFLDNTNELTKTAEFTVIQKGNDDTVAKKTGIIYWSNTKYEVSIIV